MELGLHLPLYLLSNLWFSNEDEKTTKIKIRNGNDGARLRASHLARGSTLRASYW